MKKVKMFMTGILALGVSLIVVSVVLGAIRMFVMDGDDMSECDDRHFREYYLRPGLKGEEGRFSIFTAEEFPRYARLFKTQEVLKEVKYTKSDMIVLTHNLKLTGIVLLLFDPDSPHDETSIDLDDVTWRELTFKRDNGSSVRMYVVKNGRGLDFFVSKGEKHFKASELSVGFDYWHHLSR